MTNTRKTLAICYTIATLVSLGCMGMAYLQLMTFEATAEQRQAATHALIIGALLTAVVYIATLVANNEAEDD